MTLPTDAMRNSVRAFTESHMNAHVQILRGSLAVFDPTTGDLGGLTGTTTIYDGKARVRQVQGAGILSLGEGEIDTRQTIISIPWGSPMPHRDDLVVVSGDDADPDVNARHFRVTDVESGGLFGEARRMTCTSWFENRQWDGP